MHRLLGHAEAFRDVLPGPAKLACGLHLQDLQPLGEGSQGRYRAEPDIGVVTGGAFGLTRICGLRVRNT